MGTAFDRLKAALADRYAIERELGRGGMATVYLADDLKHHRKVAVKVLHPDLAATLGPERFLREIEVAAQLNHPHILPLHDSGEVDGFLYYVMPFVEGQSLRARISREGELPIAETVRILEEVIDALTEAHAHGIVHRDIKPDNVLLRGQHAVVTDFGVAKAVSEATGRQSLTTVGVALGTPAYMAPEQAAADPHIDHRADIYAVGILAYEMLTGQPPFTGTTPQAILAAHVTQVADQVTQRRPSVPPVLAAIIMRCLAKTPADRWQTAGELLQQFEAIATPTVGMTPLSPAGVPRKWTPPRLATGTVLGMVTLLALVGWLGYRSNRRSSLSTVTSPRIAVLPFKNLGSPDDEHFADGITEEITARLGTLRGLIVISRTTTDRYKNTEKAVAQIGEELGVQYVLEGSIRWAKGPTAATSRVRVTPQLIRVADDGHIWANQYDETMADVFSVYSNVAEQVVTELGVTLGEGERQALEVRPTENAEAYEFFLRGNDFSDRSTLETDLRAAVSMYERAVQLDPKFAVAWANLSGAHASLFWSGFGGRDHTPERLALAKRAVDRALELSPDLAEAHRAMAYYHYWGHRDYDQALDELGKAQRNQPNNAELVFAKGVIYRRRGNWDSTLRYMEQAAKLSPRDDNILLNLAGTYLGLRRYGEAEQLLDRAIATAPDNPGLYERKASVYLNWKGPGAAQTVLERGAQEVGVDRILGPFLGGPVEWQFSGLLAALPGFQVMLDRVSIGLLRAPDYYLNKGTFFRARGDSARSRLFFDSARVPLEGVVGRQPDNPRYHAQLGVAYAGLGMKERAIREGEKAVQLLPIEIDAWEGAGYVVALGFIYALVGETEAAMNQLDIAVRRPTPLPLSPPRLQLDPMFARMRDNPRFQQIVAESSRPLKN